MPLADIISWGLGDTLFMSTLAFPRDQSRFSDLGCFRLEYDVWDGGTGFSVLQVT